MTFRVTRTALLGATLLGVFAMPGIALADWTEDIQDSRCDPEIVKQIGDAQREAIEARVRRAEAAILPPSAVGDLGCLNDLMTAPLAMFSNIGGTLTSLQAGLGSFSPESIGVDMDVSGMLCKAAAQKWSELTEPLSAIPGTLNDFAGMAAKAPDRIASGDFSFIPGISGNSSSTDSSGYAGSVADYTPPSTSVSGPTSSRPIFPGYVDPTTTEYDGTQMAEDSAAYTNNLAVEFANYLACRINASSGYYDADKGSWVAGTTCTFDGGTPPAYSFGAPPEPTTTVAPKPETTGERPYGTTEPVPSGGAASEQAPAAASGPSAIWKSLGTAGK